MIDLKNRKFETLDVADCSQLQQLLLDNGCCWLDGSNTVKLQHLPYIYVNKYCIMTWDRNPDEWNDSPFKETTIEELLATTAEPIIDLQGRTFSTNNVTESVQLQKLLLNNGCIWQNGSNEVQLQHLPNIHIDNQLKMSWDNIGDVKGTPLRGLLAELSVVPKNPFLKNARNGLDDVVNAADVLRNGAKHIDDRAVVYDKPEGERSMGKTVAAFNIITGHALTEEQGWLFMGILKKSALTTRRV